MEPDSPVGPDFLATYQHYKDFISSVLWMDLQREVGSWIEDIHGYMENETDIQEIYRFQGRLQSCKQLLNLPARILSAIEATYEIVHEQEVALDLTDNASDGYYQEQLQKWSEEDLENG